MVDRNEKLFKEKIRLQNWQEQQMKDELKANIESELRDIAMIQ